MIAHVTAAKRLVAILSPIGNMSFPFRPEPVPAAVRPQHEGPMTATGRQASRSGLQARADAIAATTRPRRSMPRARPQELDERVRARWLEAGDDRHEPPGSGFLQRMNVGRQIGDFGSCELYLWHRKMGHNEAIRNGLGRLTRPAGDGGEARYIGRHGRAWSFLANNVAGRTELVGKRATLGRVRSNLGQCAAIGAQART